MFSKKVVQADNSLLSNERLAEYLDTFPFKYEESYNAEMITLKEISEKSLLLASFLRGMDRIQLGDKKYYRNGHIIFRTHPNMPRPIKQTQKKSFIVTKRVS